MQNLLHVIDEEVAIINAITIIILGYTTASIVSEVPVIDIDERPIIMDFDIEEEVGVYVAVK